MEIVLPHQGWTFNNPVSAVVTKFRQRSRDIPRRAISYFYIFKYHIYIRHGGFVIGGTDKKSPDGKRKTGAGGKRSVKAQQKSEERYRSLFESMGDGLCIGELIYDEDGVPVDSVILDVNPAYEKQTGIPGDRLVGRRITEIFPGIGPEWFRRCGEAISTGKPVQFEDYIAPAGRWFEVRVITLRGGARFAIAFSDITLRKKAEEALQRSEAFLNYVFDSIQDGISVLDRDLNVIRTNFVMKEWYPHAIPLEGKKCYQVYHGRSMPCDVCPSLRAIGQKTMQSDVVPFQNESGDVKGWQEIVVFPLVDGSGNVTGVIEHVRDITERKRAEEALCSSEARFRALFENAGTAIVIVNDATGAVMDCNSNAEKLLGRPRDEITGMNVMQLHPPEHREEHHGNIVRQAGQGRVVSYEVEVLHKDGRKIPVILNATPVMVDGRKIMLGFFMDITERKRAEDSLRESEEKFRALTETVSAAICILQDGRFQYVNPAMEAITGYTREELMSIDFRNLVHTDSLDYVISRYVSWLAGSSDEARGEFKGVDRNGMVRCADISRKTISYNGKPAILITGIDVTDRRLAEDALRESEEKFRVLAETSPTAICVFRGDQFVYVNPAVERMSGYTKEDFLKMRIWDLLIPECRDRLMKRAENRKHGTGVPSHYELGFYHKDGEVRWVDITLGPVNIGGLPGYIVSANDVTERRRVEKELLDAKSQAELYLDLMGHDINNMHQMALGYLEIARDAQADESQKVFLDKPIEVLQRSSRLIRNVRKLQRLREGKINAQMIDLCTLLSDLGREYDAPPDKTVTVNLNGHTRCCVRANELLYDVFANLVSNAIKHTEGRASITISLDIRKEADRLSYLVSVEDDGQGIPDNIKDCIFSRLIKGNTRTNGSGIGLYLVKSLVDSYQGHVWVEDRVSGDYTKGARFAVLLPATETLPDFHPM